MSFQVQPQQQQPQQPGQVYPNTFTGRPASPSQHSSNGNFGAVFIVLAIIIVVSAIACFLGRLCNRRYQKQKPPKQQNRNFRPKDQGDIEFGVNFKKMPSAKAAAAAGGGIGGSRGFKPHANGEMRGFKPHGNGEMRGFQPHGNGEMRGFKPHGDGEMRGFDEMKASEDEGDHQQRAGA